MTTNTSEFTKKMLIEIINRKFGLAERGELFKLEAAIQKDLTIFNLEHTEGRKGYKIINKTSFDEHFDEFLRLNKFYKASGKELSQSEYSGEERISCYAWQKIWRSNG